MNRNPNLGQFIRDEQAFNKNLTTQLESLNIASNPKRESLLNGVTYGILLLGCAYALVKTAKDALTF